MLLQSSSCDAFDTKTSTVSTITICPQFFIPLSNTSYYSITFLAVHRDHPLVVFYPGNPCRNYSKISMLVGIGISVFEIPSMTHKLQIWPATLLDKREEHIKILLTVINKDMEKTDRPECSLVVKLFFGPVEELKFPSNPIAQLHVPHNLSHFGIKKIINFLHKTHYIAEPISKTITRSEVSHFCHMQLHLNDFTYYSRKELLIISKYFNTVNGLIFSGLKLEKKVLYFV